jgi:predicted SprT family Zn-dependent metalloprotease
MHEYMLWLQKECRKQTEYYVRLAETKLGIVIPMPNISFSNMGRTAGRAWSSKNLIEYNPKYLKRNSEDFLKTCTGHEVAHLIAHAKYDPLRIPISAHGPEWGKIMWTFSLPATRCHNYEQVNAGTARQAVAYSSEGRKIIEGHGKKIVTFED